MTFGFGSYFGLIRSLLFLFSLFLGQLAYAQQKPLEMTSPLAYQGVAGVPLQIRLTAVGGRTPYVWRLSRTYLPEGLKLDTATGVISGIPTASGEFRVPIVVVDSSAPAQEMSVELILNIRAAIELKWKQEPRIKNDGISGSVVVTNNSGRKLQLTVIVLAVNEINKAFALGYQHFDLYPGSDSPVIPFESGLPFGSYVIHADAVAEDVTKKMVYRSRLQTSRRLILKQH